MAGAALIIGGTGQVGRAAARGLIADGWSVTVAHRGASEPVEGASAVTINRDDEAAMDALLGQGVDIVVDLVAFRPNHAEQLLRHKAGIGSAILLSSAAVYRDAAGRTLQGVTSEADAPAFDGWIDEDADTVPADAVTYAGRKRALEEALLQGGMSATILRPAGIYGPGSPQPREWFYVRRMLDQRPFVVLGYGGRSTMHPVSTDNLGEMIRLAAAQPGPRILNAGDPGLPDEREIAGAIAAAMDRDIAMLLVPGPAPIAGPWSLPQPFLLSTEAAADAIGYAPVADYAWAVRDTVAWLLAEHESGRLAPRLETKFGPPGLGCQVFVGGGAAPFDYTAEDKVVAALH
jgi:nucleoside-diphosphate-sugar epimerase